MTPVGDRPTQGDGWERVSASGLRRVYRILCHIAHCDHELHPTERALLERYRARFGIGETEAALLEDEGKKKQIRLGRHDHEQHMLMWAMVDVAAADGRLERSEHKRLMKVSGAIGLPQAELVALIRRRFSHDRAGLPPRPPGPKTAVIEPYRVAPRAIPDTLVNVRVPVPPTIGPVPAPLREERHVPPTDREVPVPRGLFDEEPPPADPFARAPSIPLYEDEEEERRDVRETIDVPPPSFSADVARRAEMKTPMPDDPATPLPGFEPLGPGGDTSLSLSPGAIVLLGVSAREVRIDLTTVNVGAEFRGFGKVPPGLHWISAPTPDGLTSLWLDLPGGGVVVKVFDQRLKRFVDAAPRTEERYKVLARGGLGGGLVEYPYDLAVEWVELTVHLDPQAFPPGLHTADVQPADPSATRFETALEGTHRGDGQAFLTELSWAFLAGALERHPAALERWLFLVKASFEAEPHLLAKDPATAVLLVDLVLAQLQQMPPTFFDVGITTGAADLADALRAAGGSHLAEAAARLRAGVAEAARRR